MSFRAMHWTLQGVFLVLLAACSHQGAAPLPEENQVVGACYNPFFVAAELGDTEKMKSILSRATRDHFEKVVFPDPKAPVLNWDDFTVAYRSMHVSRIVSDVIVQGDRAVVKDPVGGTLRCVREGGTWKVDLTPK